MQVTQSRRHTKRSLRRFAVAILAAASLFAGTAATGPAAEPIIAAPTAGMFPGTHAWRWPLLPAPAVIRGFARPPQRWLAGHRGADLRARDGQVVTSPAAGTVSFVGFVVDRAVISIDHGDGRVSSFEPVRSPLGRGDHVLSGQAIGTIAGRSHCPSSCLHWGVRLRGEYVDPLQFVTDVRPSVLLALPAAEPG